MFTTVFINESYFFYRTGIYKRRTKIIIYIQMTKKMIDVVSSVKNAGKCWFGEMKFNPIIAQYQYYSISIYPYLP